MDSSIIGALYLGLVAGAVSPALPPDSISAPAIPSPQCVVCGRATREAIIYDWSVLTDGRRAVSPSGHISRQGILDAAPEQQLGIAEEQIRRMAEFSGV